MSQGRDIIMEQDGPLWRGRFAAMASPCECLIRGVSESLAWRSIQCVAEEVWRIEHKFSRYRDDNLMATINNASGQWVALDDETARLLDLPISVGDSVRAPLILPRGCFAVPGSLMAQTVCPSRPRSIPCCHWWVGRKSIGGPIAFVCRQGWSWILVVSVRSTRLIELSIWRDSSLRRICW